ncbi:MAG TPA: hypothetical protein VG324_13910 [Blastocatellia bacterium]|nr:hypothetical protein [Blastocatellia bacterium]
MNAPNDSNDPRNEFVRRCDTIEEAYEFMLAYAAQGLTGDASTGSGGQVREFLARAATALTGMGDLLAAAIERERLEPAERYRAYAAVVDRDARDSLAAIELVLAQPSISSQLVDNLNASIHLRALLTDLFLVDEILKTRNVSIGDR